MIRSPHILPDTLVLGLALLLSVPASLCAEQLKDEAYPSVEQASFHQLVFADQDFVVLNNRYPPSGDSGFHGHDRDQFYVVIEHTESRGQALGGPLKAGPSLSAGAAGYGGVYGERRVHRVINGDKDPSQFIVIEFLRAKPSGIEVSTRDQATRYVQITDNPRLRAWRLILEPGESAPAITQVGKGVRVVVRGGLLTTSSPGSADQVHLLRPADFNIQAAGTTRALRNSGTETIELVELELK